MGEGEGRDDEEGVDYYDGDEEEAVERCKYCGGGGSQGRKREREGGGRTGFFIALFSVGEIGDRCVE